MQATYSNAQFISDLHLTEDRPDCIRAFFRFLEQLPTETDALFILGDFFEYWLGDDVLSPLATQVATQLHEVSHSKGVDLYFVAGNRDFAIGDEYCKRCHMTPIADNSLFTIAGKKVSLSHGDLFCTDDVKYQRFRKIIRHPVVLFLLKSMPQKRRIKLAQSLRAKSRQQFQVNPMMIDVNLMAVEREFNASQADIIVHGHTHIADIHEHQLAEKSVKTRMVLGDWHLTGWNGVINSDGVSLKRFKI